MTDQEASQIETVRFLAQDGRYLTGTRFVPVRGNGRSVLVNGATGVPRGYYAAYASFLTAAGFEVLTYDYRGVGDSIVGPIHDETATFRQWGEEDTAAAISFLSSERPERKLLVVGHSAGGQLLGLAANNDRVMAMLTVGSQSGYWKHWPFPRKWLLAALWYAGIPLSTRLCSYFPAKRLGLGGADLPAGVARQWSLWCRHPDYMVDDAGRPLRRHFKSFDGDILSYTIEDDWIAPPKAVDALMAFYSRARIERRTIHTEDRRIGHFGYFRQAHRALWDEGRQWMHTLT